MNVPWLRVGTQIQCHPTTTLNCGDAISHDVIEPLCQTGVIFSEPIRNHPDSPAEVLGQRPGAFARFRHMTAGTKRVPGRITRTAAQSYPGTTATFGKGHFISLWVSLGVPDSGYDAYTAATLWREHRFSAPDPGPPRGRPPTRGTSHR
jgi:hypothetical protein